MRVRENYGIDFGYWRGKSSIFFFRFAALSLKHPAVECDCMAVHVQQVTRARDLPGRASERNLQVV
jgi:hypothetical protein